MKFLVISDTHGNINEAVKILKNEKFDYCIHLGDVIADCEDLESIFPEQKFIFVRGNNDFWANSSAYPYERFFELDGKKFFICHGHKYNVKSTLASLKAKGREMEADIILYGHTHSKHIEKDGEILILNPGASRSYGVIIIENGEIHSSLYFDGDKI